MSTALIYDPRFLDHDTSDTTSDTTSGHPETPRRLEAVLAALQADEALWGSLQCGQPVLASREDLARCHTVRLAREIEKSASAGLHGLDSDTRISRRSFEVACLAAGAAIRGVDMVMGREASNVFAALRPPGHHARPDQAMGFCLFNNVAIAARYAQARYDVERVLIVDWDVHHGNGTQEIFYDDSTVFFFSTHQYPWYPGTGSRVETGTGPGEGATLNIPLAGGTPAATHREAFGAALRSIGSSFRPDLVLISAGFDSRRGDPLGGLLLEDSDFREMTLEVMDLADRAAGGRIVSLLEGGYHLGNLGEAVRSHVAALAGRQSG